MMVSTRDPLVRDPLVRDPLVANQTCNLCLKTETECPRGVRAVVSPLALALYT